MKNKYGTIQIERVVEYERKQNVDARIFGQEE